jgi:hypothetical protein
MGHKRLAALEDVPTISRLSEARKRGLGRHLGEIRNARAGDHAALAAVNKAITTDKVREALAKIGVDPGGGSPEAFGTLVHGEIAHWSKVIKDAGIKINS